MNLRIFSKIVAWSTLVLIFVGAMVKSTGSGLAVPDWPLSYGMLFPPMVGGVFYEHGHRMVATLVGFLTLCLTLWLFFSEKRLWVKVLGGVALVAVILQGVLGGLTVLFFLPAPISVAHGVLAQTFFLLTIWLAYSLSHEWERRVKQEEPFSSCFIKVLLLCIVLLYGQLILGAVMRHTESGLAIPDFPTMGGQWWPMFNDAMLINVNSWRFHHDLDPVTKMQMVYHFLHRLGALLVLIGFGFLNLAGFNQHKNNVFIKNSLMLLNAIIGLQIVLGIATVLTLKSPIVTSLHVLMGAATLGVTFLLFLRATPVSLEGFKKVFHEPV